MNEVVVGVKRVSPDGSALTPEEAEMAKAAVQAHWVTIDGHEVPGVIRSAECVADEGFLRVRIEFITAGFRTADYRGPDAPERFREEQK